VLSIGKYVYREIKENEVNYLIELLASALAILNDLRQYQLNSTQLNCRQFIIWA
jgi:hypothetical protein